MKIDLKWAWVPSELALNFARALAQGSKVILRLSSVDKLVQAGELASLPERRTPADKKWGSLQKGCFDSEAHPQSERKWNSSVLELEGDLSQDIS